MTHAREQIRDKAVTRLTGLTTTGSRVYRNRVYPMADSNLPGLLVFATTEEVRTDGGEIGTQERELSLVVEGYAKATSDLDETLDDIAEQVETAMFSDPYFDDLVKSCVLESTEISMTDDAEKPAGVITMTWRLIYFTREGSPSTII